MRLHGLLCFFDEPIKDLVACVTSLKRAGVDHLLAVDGAFALYPDAQPASHPNQHGALALACRELGLALTLHVPAEPWQGNEAEKRTFHFQLAWATADEGDWFWIMDADQVVTKCPLDLKERLAGTDCDAAEVEFLDVPALRANIPNWPARFTVSNLFRAQLIRCDKHHAVYVTDDGRRLWLGVDSNGPPVPTLDLTKVVEVEHRPDHRPHERQAAKLEYYAKRDELGVERGDCATCGDRAVRVVAYKWRKSRLGPVAQWVEACSPCGDRLEKVGRIRLRQLGGDPERGVENRNGKAPAGMTS